MEASCERLVQPELELNPTRQPNYTRVERFFSNLCPATIDSYIEYWSGIAPTNDDDALRRWIFAFLSVHTSWKANVTGYNALKDLGWTSDINDLKQRLITSRIGLHNNRTKFIWGFYESFKANVSDFFGKPSEWRSHRDDLITKITGLGNAKVSFALEMSHPTDCGVVCMDTHMFAVYGLDQTKDSKQYKVIEAHWLNMCRAFNIAPYIARCIFWDKKQKKTDSRYWSYVLEQ